MLVAAVVAAVMGFSFIGSLILFCFGRFFELSCIQMAYLVHFKKFMV